MKQRTRLTLYESKLPWFRIVPGTAWVMFEGERRTTFWLRCPRRKCREIFALTPEGLGKSRFLTRPCPNCFAVAQLPMKLRAFVALEPPDG